MPLLLSSTIQLQRVKKARRLDVLIIMSLYFMHRLGRRRRHNLRCGSSLKLPQTTTVLSAKQWMPYPCLSMTQLVHVVSCFTGTSSAAYSGDIVAAETPYGVILAMDGATARVGVAVDGSVGACSSGHRHPHLEGWADGCVQMASGCCRCTRQHVGPVCHCDKGRRGVV